MEYFRKGQKTAKGEGAATTGPSKASGTPGHRTVKAILRLDSDYRSEVNARGYQGLG
jgi:hypothetical protein